MSDARIDTPHGARFSLLRMVSSSDSRSIGALPRGKPRSPAENVGSSTSRFPLLMGAQNAGARCGARRSPLITSAVAKLAAKVRFSGCPD